MPCSCRDRGTDYGTLSKLSPQQIKSVIEKSAVAPADKVNIPGTDEKAALTDISKTGGIVNAYEAIKLAGYYQPPKTKEVLPNQRSRNQRLVKVTINKTFMARKSGLFF
jgi:hypothetical protein